jgi:hypothetical protein
MFNDYLMHESLQKIKNITLECDPKCTNDRWWHFNFLNFRFVSLRIHNINDFNLGPFSIELSMVVVHLSKLDILIPVFQKSKTHLIIKTVQE